MIEPPLFDGFYMVGPHYIGFRDVDLEVSALLFADGSYRPPLRKLSWEGSTLLMPTRHLEARLVGDTVWSWWEWDSVDGEEILRAANPELADTEALSVEEFIVPPVWEPRLPRWADSAALEAALAADLAAVRAQRASGAKDLNDPRVVYELGERIFSEWDKCRSYWHRFGAYVSANFA